MIGLVALAGGLGALARVEWTAHAARRWPDAPWGTRGANLVGTAALLALWLAGPDGEVARVAGVGFLGGFTTFSTWMVDAHRRGRRAWLGEVAGQAIPALAVASLVVAAHGGAA